MTAANEPWNTGGRFCTSFTRISTPVLASCMPSYLTHTKRRAKENNKCYLCVSKSLFTNSNQTSCSAYIITVKKRNKNGSNKIFAIVLLLLGASRAKLTFEMFCLMGIVNSEKKHQNDLTLGDRMWGPEWGRGWMSNVPSVECSARSVWAWGECDREWICALPNITFCITHMLFMIIALEASFSCAFHDMTSFQWQ